jgi:hypothetical protein
MPWENGSSRSTGPRQFRRRRLIRTRDWQKPTVAPRRPCNSSAPGIKEPCTLPAGRCRQSRLTGGRDRLGDRSGSEPPWPEVSSRNPATRVALDLPGLVDDAHAAAAQFTQDFVAGDRRNRRRARRRAAVDRQRGCFRRRDGLGRCGRLFGGGWFGHGGTSAGFRLRGRGRADSPSSPPRVCGARTSQHFSLCRQAVESRSACTKQRSRRWPDGHVADAVPLQRLAAVGVRRPPRRCHTRRNSGIG